MRFWDSSAVVPMLVDQEATPSVSRVLGEDPVMAAWWGTPVECASAVARLEREGALRRNEVDDVRVRLATLSAGWHEVQPTEPVRRAAHRMLRVHPLRAVDALQAAAALVLAEHDPLTMEVVCLDERLGEALGREGFTVIVPG